MNQHQIHCTNNATYLGFFFDEHLIWTKHIQHIIICKENSASIVWCLHTNCNIHKLEMIHHLTARFITNSYSCWVSVSEILIYQLRKNFIKI